MRNAILFAKREFLERVRTKAFVLTTVLIPLMIFAFGLLPTLMMNKSSGQRNIEVVTSNAALGMQIKSNLEKRSAESKDNPDFVVTLSTDASDANREALTKRVDDDKSTKGVRRNDRLDGFVWATDSTLANNKPVYYGTTVSDFKMMSLIESSVQRAVHQQRLVEHGISPVDAESLMKPIDLEMHQVSKGTVKEASGAAAFFTPFILMFMMYMVMIIYGMMVMRSVVEEKNSKIFEVLLSTATSQQLMAGKLLGVGAVGLLQVAIWSVAGLLVSAPGVMTMASMVKFSPGQFAYFALFFVLGYLIYSGLFAALGAMVSSEQEANQLQSFVMMPLILCMVFITKVIAEPNGAVAFWASMFPLTSPLIMYVRIIAQQPPVWQIGASVGIAIVSIFILIWICSRIYRVGILMYGKRPTLPEIVKWIKYA